MSLAVLVVESGSSAFSASLTEAGTGKAPEHVLVTLEGMLENQETGLYASEWGVTDVVFIFFNNEKRGLGIKRGLPAAHCSCQHVTRESTLLVVAAEPPHYMQRQPGITSK